MVVSREVAASRLRRLEQCVKRLSQLAALSLDDYLKNGDAQIIAERQFQIAAQCLLDLANHIIAEQGLGTPEDAHGILDCLVRGGILSAELHERTRGLAGFRNILVHDYLAVDHRIVHALLQRVTNLIEFGKVLGDYVERQSDGAQPQP